MTQTQPNTPEADALRAALAFHSGSEELHRVNRLTPNFLVTDGVKDMAELASAFWFCDLVASHAPAIVARDHFASLTLEVSADNTAQFSATDGREPPQLYASQAIPLTDFPCGTWKFYLSNDGSNTVLMLPGEY